MSMLYDIAEVCKDIHNKEMSKHACAELFADIVGMLEWDVFDVDLDSEDFQTEEINQAYRFLWKEK